MAEFESVKVQGLSKAQELLSEARDQGLITEDLFDRILDGVPRETHDYLKRVEERRAMYAKGFVEEN